MARTWLIAALAICVASTGMLRADRWSLDKAEGERSAYRDADGCPMDYPPLRISAGSELCRVAYGESKWQVTCAGPLDCGRKSFSTVSSFARARASSRQQTLLALRIKLQV